MPASLFLTSPALFVVLASEVISLRWQAGGKSAAELGIYRESLFYTAPNRDVSVQNLPIEGSQVGFLTYDRGRRLAVPDRNASRGMELLYLEYDGTAKEILEAEIGEVRDRQYLQSGLCPRVRTTLGGTLALHFRHFVVP